MKFLLVLLFPLTVFGHTSEYVYQLCKSQNVKVDCDLVVAIAFAESSFIPTKYNPEGSYGLMQVQCGTARFLGYKGSCVELMKPVVNMYYAVRYLQYQARRFPKITDQIASYNSGTPIVCRDYNPGHCYPGQYFNNYYVKRVLGYYLEFRQKDKNSNINFNSLSLTGEDYSITHF